jgi:uncharacterized protein (TIGR03067 family)
LERALAGVKLVIVSPVALAPLPFSRLANLEDVPMRICCVGLVALVLATSVVTAGSDQAKKDVAALQGTWNVTKLEYEGKDITGEHKLSLRFQGDTAAVEGDPKVKTEYGKIKFKLDPSTTPKCVDLTVTAGDQLNVTMEGIYAVKGDELKLCVRVLGNERPTKFTSPGDAPVALVTLKRQK